MSYVFPGTDLKSSRSQTISLDLLIQRIDEWSEAAGGGVLGAPTYKSSNRLDAYFSFLRTQNEHFDQEKAGSFVANPDAPQFTILRKYMIVFANVLLAAYKNLNLSASIVDYLNTCEYARGEKDLINNIAKWAEEIDPDHPERLVEINAIVDNMAYPIAYYSTSGKRLRIYPFNTINPVVLKQLAGWDENEKEFTIAKFDQDLAKMTGADRALYAALDADAYGLKHINAMGALKEWLKNTHPNVVTPAGAAFPLEVQEMNIEHTIEKIDLPLCAGPIDIPVDDMFSDMLLIIKTNANVQNNEFNFCKIDNLLIQDSSTTPHAVIPPLSEELMEKIRQNDDIVFDGCTVSKEDEHYVAEIYLKINGQTYKYPHQYKTFEVKKCDNFPIISILKAQDHAPTQIRLHRTDYVPTKENEGRIDGENILLGNHAHPVGLHFEIHFGGVIVTDDNVQYFGVRYRDFDDDEIHSFGYLFFDKNHPSSEAAKSAKQTAVVIDDENNVARIARFDPISGKIEAYNVYNDRILFFNKNGRKDLDTATGKIWGKLNQTIFDQPAQYVLAPFSREFSHMIEREEVSIQAEETKLVRNGSIWKFSVSFTYLGSKKKAAPRIYMPHEQYSCNNPPFFFTVSTVEKGTLNPGYEVGFVRNMRVTTPDEGNIIDSNDLVYELDDLSVRLNDGKGVFMADPYAYIQVRDSDDAYYGQIVLPLATYMHTVGFHPLTDAATSCSAILLIKDKGALEPKQIITGGIFDDNLFLIAEDTSRKDTQEYKAWRKFAPDLFVPVQNMPQVNEKKYEAVFPFGLKMLQNLSAGDLSIANGTTPDVTYDRNEKAYRVTVHINTADKTTPFTMLYHESKVIKCDNLPFIVPLSGEHRNYIARFDNEQGLLGPKHVDGSGLKIEYISRDDAKGIDHIVEVPSISVNSLDATAISVNEKNVILKMTAQREDNFYTCHALYELDKVNALRPGVHVVKSTETGAQHVFDFYDNEHGAHVKEIEVFTEYMMWTPSASGEFGTGSHCKKIVGTPGTDNRILSIPITKEFTALMEKRGVSIDSYNNVMFYTDPVNKQLEDVDHCSAVFVEIHLTGMMAGGSTITKRFPKNRILDFMDHPLPTLTVFPYVNFIAGDGFSPDLKGKSLWQQYSYARFTPELQAPNKANRTDNLPLGSRVEIWVNGEKAEFQERSTVIIDKQEDSVKTRMEIAKINGWGRYIHMVYDGSGQFAPNIPADFPWDGKELGCILMEPASPTIVNQNMEATVGVDFGTRNSIIAIKNAMGNVSYPFHGDEELQKIIIPNMPEKAFRNFSNLSYVPHFEGRPGMLPGCGKFSSNVMVYSMALKNLNELIPYDLGFVPNVRGDVLKKVMEQMGENIPIGLYSDLKVSTDGHDPGAMKLMERNVALFIRSIMFHIVLNCYREACGKINIRISMPSEQFRERNQYVWGKAQTYIRDFLPVEAFSNIRIGEYDTEANALFTYVRDDLIKKGAGISAYSAITDGGDGTYDFSINKARGVGMPPEKVVEPFSLLYAGQQIMTDSVNAFFDHLVRKAGSVTEQVKSDFLDMWNGATSVSNQPDETLVDIVNQYANYRAEGGNNRQKMKTFILMLIEQFGINTNCLRNPHPTDDPRAIITAKYQNFVRMIQYKFLFLFNILGEAVRKNTDLNRTPHNSFTIFLYGGTAQALTIAEPYTNGILKMFDLHPESLPMAMFISSMMNLGNNIHGDPIHLKFISADDSEKIEIANGLTLMPVHAMNNFNAPVGEGTDTVIPNFAGMNINDGAADSAPTPFGTFGVQGVQMQNAAVQSRDSKRPQGNAVFIDDLKKMLLSRTILLSDRKFYLDSFLPFLDKNGKYVNLSQILDDPVVQANMDIDVVWEDVMEQNKTIRDPEMLYHIFTLKMVGNIIESYLKK